MRISGPFALDGYEGGKNVVGRKRHIAVDTEGHLLMVNLTPADISDSAGAVKVLEAVRQRWPWLKHWFADSAYDRRKLLDKAALLNFMIEVVRKLRYQFEFIPLPRRCLAG